MKRYVYTVIVIFLCTFLNCHNVIMAQESLTFKVGDATFKMIRVKHGSFNMGDDGHKVRMELTKDFYVSETEVTCKLWSAVMNTSWKSDIAVETRWDDVQEFLKRLSNMTEKIFAY